MSAHDKSAPWTSKSLSLAAIISIGVKTDQRARERTRYAFTGEFARSMEMLSGTAFAPPRRLRLLNVVSSMNPAAGGISEAVATLSKALEDLGHEVETVSADAPDCGWRATCAVPVHCEGPARGFLESSERLNAWMRQNSARFDALLCHGIWRDCSSTGRRVALELKRPYFVFPHGMLDPWFKRFYPVKHLKKCLYWWFVESAVLRDAEAVLFTSDEEMLSARNSFWPYRVVERVVPFGIAEPPAKIEQQNDAYRQAFPTLRAKRVLLFLGRLHEKKGCDLLLSGFLQVLKSRPPEIWRDLHVMIAGPCAQPAYLNSLQAIAAECNTASADSVSFPGMISGDLKWGAVRNAEVFILPSHQENFGVAVVEALACGTPVLITPRVNIWREIESAGAGLAEADTLDGTTRLLTRWLGLTPEARSEMEIKAAACFQQRFEIARTAASLVETIEAFPSVQAVRGNLVRTKP